VGDKAQYEEALRWIARDAFWDEKFLRLGTGDSSQEDLEFARSVFAEADSSDSLESVVEDWQEAEQDAAYLRQHFQKWVVKLVSEALLEAQLKEIEAQLEAQLKEIEAQ